MFQAHAITTFKTTIAFSLTDSDKNDFQNNMLIVIILNLTAGMY